MLSLWLSNLLFSTVVSIRRANAAYSTNGLFLKPRLIQLIIHSLLCQQLTMLTLLDDLPIVNDHDPICIRDRRNLMRDHKGCASLQQLRQRGLNDLLGLNIH